MDDFYVCRIRIFFDFRNFKQLGNRRFKCRYCIRVLLYDMYGLKLCKVDNDNDVQEKKKFEFLM